MNLEENANQDNDTIEPVLRHRLQSRETCAEVIDSFDNMVGSIFDFIARLLGHAGARAVMNRSLQLTIKRSSLAREIRVTADCLDFSDFRIQALQSGCTKQEVVNVLVSLGSMVFQTLSELTGDALTTPLLRRLKEEERS